MAHDTQQIPITTYYIRADRYRTRASQMAVIVASGRTEQPIWVEGENEETWADVHASTEPGEAVGVVGVHRIAPVWTMIVARLDELHQRGVYVYDLERDVLVDPGSAAAVLDAKRIVDGARKMPSPEIARARGALGGTKGWSGYSPDERRRIRDAWLTAETVADAAVATGLSKATLYRLVRAGHLPPRGTD